jgi:hypothetical protein
MPRLGKNRGTVRWERRRCWVSNVAVQVNGSMSLPFHAARNAYVVTFRALRKITYFSTSIWFS